MSAAIWDYEAVTGWVTRRGLDPDMIKAEEGTLCLDHCIGTLHEFVMVDGYPSRGFPTRPVVISWPAEDPPPSSVPVHSKWYGCTADHEDEYRMIEQQGGNP